MRVKSSPQKVTFAVQCTTMTSCEVVPGVNNYNKSISAKKIEISRKECGRI